MDAKITKQRLSRLLSYDWIKIVAVAVALMIVWNLIFTMTSTRVRPSQQFTVFNHYANRSLSDDFYDDFYKTVADGKVFSYEVIEPTNNDLTTAGDTRHTLIEARLATDEGDVIFLPNLPDVDTAYEENGVTMYRANYLQSFLRGYRFYLHDLDFENEKGYFNALQSYLNGYYQGGYHDAERLDEAEVEKDFRARAKANKDKRFKTEEQLKNGARAEVERIQKYRDALVKMEGFLADGLVELTDVAVYNEDGSVLYQGKFALNLCPNKQTMGDLKKQFSYQVKEKDAEGKEQVRITAENMHVMFFRTEKTEQSFEYESLLYVVDLIEKSKTVETVG